MPRLSRLAVLVALATVPVAYVTMGMVGVPGGGEGVAFADDNRSDIDVGTELEATSDVTLHRAEIAKGSKVSVTRVLVRSGQVDGVSVALADGHVVKVTMTQVHSYFRVVHD